MKPAITVITAVYNGALTIRDCVNSVSSQSVLAEHVIVDGASSDNTIEIVRGLRPDATIVSEHDRGIYDAMNKGIRLAKGDVIGILNADDLYSSPNVLAKVLEKFEDPNIDCCYGDLLYVKEGACGGSDTDGQFQVSRYWKSGTFHPDRFRWGWMPPHPTFFVRRPVYEKFGGFNLGLGSAADYELMLRFLVKHRLNTTYLPEILVKMRAGGVSNASIRNRMMANMMDRKAWQVNDLKPLPWTLYLKPLRKVSQWLLRPPRESE
ncbi:MAG TPA: glycosyltransferase family 2 protein [Geomonas sp.]|nr:glycosyltransferase family 2 protein [Geomonas sp.]